jgi:hypothetical protein
MSRTKSHRPRKARPYGENIDNAANLPTHGRGGSFIRSLNRAMDDRLLRVKSRERVELLSTLSTIRSLDDAEDAFGAGNKAADPYIMGDVMGRVVGFARREWWMDRMDDGDMEWATYDREQDDIADAEWEAEQATLRAEAEQYRYWQDVADLQWEAEMREADKREAAAYADIYHRCPCCGR